MPQYRLTNQAQQDLIQIRRFTLERWGHKQSVHYLSDLKNTLQLLSEMPSIGKDCFVDLGKNIYRFPFNSHMIYYLTTTIEAIIVVAILHQSMVPGKHLGKRT